MNRRGTRPESAVDGPGNAARLAQSPGCCHGADAADPAACADGASKPGDGVTPAGQLPGDGATPAGQLPGDGATTADADARRPLNADAQFKACQVRRLRRAEGQVRGILRMVEEDRYCADVLVQIAAARQSLQAVAHELLNSHIEHCVADAVRRGEPRSRQALDELKKLIDQVGRS